MALRERDGVAHASHHRHAVQQGAVLGGVVVEEPHQLHARRGAFQQLAPDGQAVLARAGDQHAVRGGESRARWVRPLFGFGHRPAAQRAHAPAQEQREQHRQEQGGHRQAQRAEPAQREQPAQDDHTRHAEGERLPHAGVAPDGAVAATQTVRHDEYEPDQQGERSGLAHAHRAYALARGHRRHDGARAAAEIHAHLHGPPHARVAQPAVQRAHGGGEGPDGPEEPLGDLVQLEAGRSHLSPD